MLEQVEKIVQSIHINSPSEYSIGQKKITFDHKHSLDTIDSTSKDIKVLRESIATHIYMGFYMQGSTNFSSIQSLDDLPSENERSSYMDYLSKFNISQKKYDPYWQIYSISPSGNIHAQKNNRQIQLISSNYIMAENFTHPTVNSYVHLIHFKEDRYLQPIFYHIFGDHYLDPHAELIRFYFTMDPDHLSHFLATTTKAFNHYHFPFSMKCLNHPSLYQRRTDSVVLYIEKHSHVIGWHILNSILSKIDHCFLQKSPLFTFQIQKGLSFAEDPGRGVSFGNHIAVILSNYIVGLFTSKSKSSRSGLINHFKNSGLNVHKLYLHPDSKCKYEFIK